MESRMILALVFHAALFMQGAVGQLNRGVNDPPHAQLPPLASAQATGFQTGLVGNDDLNRRAMTFGLTSGLLNADGAQPPDASAAQIQQFRQGITGQTNGGPAYSGASNAGFFNRGQESGYNSNGGFGGQAFATGYGGPAATGANNGFFGGRQPGAASYDGGFGSQAFATGYGYGGPVATGRFYNGGQSGALNYGQQYGMAQPLAPGYVGNPNPGAFNEGRQASFGADNPSQGGLIATEQRGPPMLPLGSDDRQLPSSILKYRNRMLRGRGPLFPQPPINQQPEVPARPVNGQQPDVPAGLINGQQSDAPGSLIGGQQQDGGNLGLPGLVNSPPDDRPLPESILKFRRIFNSGLPAIAKATSPPTENINMPGILTEPPQVDENKQQPSTYDATKSSAYTTTDSTLLATIDTTSSSMSSTTDFSSTTDGTTTLPTTTTAAPRSTTPLNKQQANRRQKNNQRRNGKSDKGTAKPDRQCVCPKGSKKGPKDKPDDMSEFSKILSENGKSGEAFEEEIKDFGF